MGRRFVNMMSVMKTMMMAAVLLLAMHTANAVRCRVANGAVFTHLMAQNTVCDDAACAACGSGTEVTAIEAAAGGINSATLMLAYVNNIFPSMMWRDNDGGADPSINAVTSPAKWPHRLVITMVSLWGPLLPTDKLPNTMKVKQQL